MYMYVVLCALHYQTMITWSPSRPLRSRRSRQECLATTLAPLTSSRTCTIDAGAGAHTITRTRITNITSLTNPLTSLTNGTTVTSCELLMNMHEENHPPPTCSNHDLFVFRHRPCTIYMMYVLFIIIIKQLRAKLIIYAMKWLLCRYD